MGKGKVSLTDIRLTPAESQTALWLKIKAGIEIRLEELRATNDNSMHESDTAKLRGRIAELKVLLALGDPGPAVTSDADE